jgi:hypothetical protein
MATEVSWGMRMRPATLDACWAALDRVRPDAEALVASEKARALAASAVAALDASALRGEPAGDPLGAAFDACEASRRPDAPYDPLLDFRFRVVLAPLEGRVYASALVARRAYGEFLPSRGLAEPFAWGLGDPPADVPKAEWAERRRVWSAIAARDPGTRLAGCGLMLEYLDRHAAIDVAAILAAAPCRAERIERVARHHVLEARTRATGNTIRAAVEAGDWISGPEGTEAIASARRLAAERLPDLDGAGLRGRT